MTRPQFLHVICEITPSNKGNQDYASSDGKDIIESMTISHSTRSPIQKTVSYTANGNFRRKESHEVIHETNLEHQAIISMIDCGGLKESGAFTKLLHVRIKKFMKM